MKANEAPDKIYLHPTAKGEVGASWLTLQLTDKDIEYTRTDAFIEKACKWLKENIDHYAYNKDFVSLNEFIEAFKKAMEE